MDRSVLSLPLTCWNMILPVRARQVQQSLWLSHAPVQLASACTSQVHWLAGMRQRLHCCCHLCCSCVCNQPPADHEPTSTPACLLPDYSGPLACVAEQAAGLCRWPKAAGEAAIALINACERLASAVAWQPARLHGIHAMHHSSGYAE